MSKEYDQYLTEHKHAVNQGAKWMLEQIGEAELKKILPNFEPKWLEEIANDHDRSKLKNLEYTSYDDYFYGPRGIRRKDGGSGTKDIADDDVLMAFNYGWLHHIHNNPHHWQYWVLINDDKELGCKALEMPDRYIFEMIADWWSFSWRKGDLYEIYNWMNDHSEYVLLGEVTKEKVLDLLGAILDKLNEFGGRVEDWVKQ